MPKLYQKVIKNEVLKSETKLIVEAGELGYKDEITTNPVEVYEEVNLQKEIETLINNETFLNSLEFKKTDENGNQLDKSDLQIYRDSAINEALAKLRNIFIQQEKLAGHEKPVFTRFKDFPSRHPATENETIAEKNARRIVRELYSGRILINDYIDIEKSFKNMIKESESTQYFKKNECLKVLDKINDKYRNETSEQKVTRFADLMLQQYRNIIRANDGKGAESRLALEMRNFFRDELTVALPSTLKKGEPLTLASLVHDQRSQKLGDDVGLGKVFALMIGFQSSRIMEPFNDSVNSRTDKLILELIQYRNTREQRGDSVFTSFASIFGSDKTKSGKIRAVNKLISILEAMRPDESPVITIRDDFKETSQKIPKLNKHDIEVLMDSTTGKLLETVFKKELASSGQSILPQELVKELEKKYGPEGTHKVELDNSQNKFRP